MGQHQVQDGLHGRLGPAADREGFVVVLHHPPILAQIALEIDHIIALCRDRGRAGEA
jgi:hypothetical protein